MPDSLGYDPTLDPLGHDPEGARNAWAQLQEEQGGTLEPVLIMTPMSLGLEDRLREQLAEAGIESRVLEAGLSNFKRSLGNEEIDFVLGWMKLDRAGDEQVSLLRSNSATNPTSIEPLRRAFYERQHEIRISMDRSSRGQGYAALEKIAMESLPYIPLAKADLVHFMPNVYTYHQSVRGTFDPLTHRMRDPYYQFLHTWLAPEAAH